MKTIPHVFTLAEANPELVRLCPQGPDGGNVTLNGKLYRVCFFPPDRIYIRRRKTAEQAARNIAEIHEQSARRIAEIRERTARTIAKVTALLSSSVERGGFSA